MRNTDENQDDALGVPAPMKEAWNRTLKSIEEMVRPQYFQSFILTIRLVSSKDNTLVLGFPDRFCRDWVFDHYSTLIEERFLEACSNSYRLEFSVEQKSCLLYTSDAADE